MRLGVDLRHVPERVELGAGVSHASIELTEALERIAHRYGIEVVRLYAPKRAWAFREVVNTVDALFIPSGAVPPFMPVPCYPWVHDVVIFSHPEWFAQSWLRRFVTTTLFLRGLRRARHIFAVSKDTEREVRTLTGLLSTVTYQGIRPIEAGENKPYALILGNVNPRKNIPFIESLWPEVEKIVPSAELLVAGQPYMTFDDAQRDDFVRHATVLLLPSLHEGFGRTALEAMSAGVPVIASSRGAIPEVVGDAGMLLDPTDRQAWIQGIVEAFEGRFDGSRGPKQAAQFTWDKTAECILAKIAKDW
ncbi:MAG: glycosyltransferase [Candidatus Uhrbacteria bacterium]